VPSDSASAVSSAPAQTAATPLVTHRAHPAARRRHTAPANRGTLGIGSDLTRVLSHTAALLGVSGPATIATSTTQHGGLLLLLAAIALLALLAASASLLRLLTRTNAEWWRGR
jgi:hypothetical protein